MMREIDKQDKDIFIPMVEEFYKSDAVPHSIQKSHITETFKQIIAGSSYTKGYIIEFNDEIAGYCLISLTYSNEAGGMVVWLEEIYVKDEFRGLGLASKCMDFIKKKYEGHAKRIRVERTKSNEDVENLYLRKGYKKLEYVQMAYDY